MKKYTVRLYDDQNSIHIKYDIIRQLRVIALSLYSNVNKHVIFRTDSDWPNPLIMIINSEVGDKHKQVRREISAFVLFLFLPFLL